MAQTDYFLKIDGIEGESGDHKHKNEIELESFSWGATNAGSFAAGSGGGTGKVAMQDFHFVMKVGKASPKLLLACSGGHHIPKAVLTARKAGGNQEEYLKWTFSDLLVSSYQSGVSTGGDELPTDQISMNFTKIEVEYKPQNKDGKLGGPVKAGWNVKENKKV